jgi:hypothetical protein
MKRVEKHKRKENFKIDTHLGGRLIYLLEVEKLKNSQNESEDFFNLSFSTKTCNPVWKTKNFHSSWETSLKCCLCFVKKRQFCGFILDVNDSSLPTEIYLIFIYDEQLNWEQREWWKNSNIIKQKPKEREEQQERKRVNRLLLGNRMKEIHNVKWIKVIYDIFLLELRLSSKLYSSR